MSLALVIQVRVLVPAYLAQKRVAGLNIDLKLVADQIEHLPLVLLVPHAFDVWDIGDVPSYAESSCRRDSRSLHCLHWCRDVGCVTSSSPFASPSSCVPSSGDACV